MKSKQSSLSAMGIPELRLKGDEYFHEVPAHLNLELIVEWKLGTAPKEVIGPVRAFSLEDGHLKVVNRNIDLVYTHPVKQIHRAYLLPTD